MQSHMKFRSLVVLVLFSLIIGAVPLSAAQQPAPSAPQTRSSALIIDHRHTDFAKIPEQWITTVQNDLNIYYGHTSHGSQLITGMDVLGVEKPIIREYSDDLGHNGDTSWVTPTEEHLADHPETNVVIWSWCGGAGDNTEEGINTYLAAMDQLEQDYPEVTFIYMTGHLEGTGEEGNLHQRNEQIRAYCRANNKILFDFADIESYNPDGDYFLDRDANDTCAYDGGNWATEWCAAHPDSPLCATCSCAHSEPLNCNLKGRAFWWTLAQIAGWSGNENTMGVSAETATIGQTLAYTVVIRDISTPPTATVAMNTTVPDGLAYIPGSLNATSGVTEVTTTPTRATVADVTSLTWTGPLTPTPVVTITYQVSVTTAVPQIITSTAVITAEGITPITRTASVEILRPTNFPDLSPSTKTVAPETADLGDVVTYTVSVENATGSISITTVMTDMLRPGLSYVPGSLTATLGTVDDATAPLLTWAGVLSPTPHITITYAAVVTYPIPGSTLILPTTIVNSAVIAAPGYEAITRTATLKAHLARIYLPLVIRQ